MEAKQYIKVLFIKTDHKSRRTFIFPYFSTINSSNPPYKLKWKTNVLKLFHVPLRYNRKIFPS